MAQRSRDQRRPRRGWWGIVLFGLLWGVPAAVAILSVDELQPGMKGIGKTVFQGITIDTFDFEIIDVLHSEGYLADTILIKVGGPKIEEIGGICAGMSGSPLFIGDQMVGAISFTTPRSDTRYGYATPIQDMLKVLEMDETGATIAGEPSEEGKTEAPQATPTLPEGEKPAEVGWAHPLPRWLPAGTPIMVSGLRGRPFRTLAQRLNRWGLKAVETGLPAGTVEAQEVVLRPGAAVGLSLASGDVTVTALGTLTYRSGEKILAFGHPFLQRGSTSMFLSPAYIYQVIQSTDMPFKVGAPLGDPVGVVTQDRSAAVGGWLNRTTDHFEVQIQVEDRALQRSRTMEVQVVRDFEIAPGIVAVALLQAVDETLDRIGGGTARVRWLMTGRGLDRPVERNDLVFSEEDVAVEVLSDPLLAIDRVLRNEFHEVLLDTVDLQVIVESERRTARLQHLEVSPTTVRPGDTVQLTVTLQPYRGLAEQKILYLTIPEDFDGETAVVELHGREREIELAAEGDLLVASRADNRPFPSWAEFIADLEENNRGNTLVAELVTEPREERRGRLRRETVRPDLEETPGAGETDLGIVALPVTTVEATGKGKVQLDTAYVIQGTLKKRLKVVPETVTDRP